MAFENLIIDRIAVHEVHRRLDNKQPIPPTYGQELLSLDADALAIFRDRIVAAMGSKSQSMEMAIADFDVGSAVSIAQAMLTADDSNFIPATRRFADRLTTVQARRDLPGGVVVLFSGKVGSPAKRIAGIIKAETHGGFRINQDMSVQYLNDLFMTPQTKLYKIGIFIYSGGPKSQKLPDGWSAIIYDSQMSASNRDGAAQYFYNVFLGCVIPDNSAQLTKKFFEQTRDYIKELDIVEEEKSDLLTGLYTYLKVDQSTTIETAKFSEQYLGIDLKDDYESYMAAHSFPDIAVPKDTSEITNHLKKRRLGFSRNITLTAPPDAFKELVQVEAIPGDQDQNGVGSTWTRITIRDRIRDQE